MRTAARILLAALLIGSAPLLLAQTAAGPAGHWEGAVHAPNMEVKIEIDLARNGSGELVGTFGQPAQNLKGLALANITMDGTSIGFQIKGSVPADRAFKGALSADGATIAGEFSQAGYTMPFNLTRTGDPRIEPPARSAAVGKDLEGAWHGTVDVKGVQRSLVLTLTDHPDGTSTGTFVNVEEGLEIPIAAIARTAANVTLDIKAIGGSYAGALNADATELVGTLTQGPAAVPLTLKRGATETKK